MNAINDAREILEIMLRHLGYTANVAIDTDCEVPGLQVTVTDAKAATALTGKKGERLDDIQHLVNKLLHQKLPDAPRVRVDVNHFRGRKDDDFLNEIRRLADKVRATREPIKLDPMNSYQNRRARLFLVLLGLAFLQFRDQETILGGLLPSGEPKIAKHLTAAN